MSTLGEDRASETFESGERRDVSNRSSWILYVVLVLCRVAVSPFLPGYVHPDEFFQGGQELWFGCPPFTPWEFEPENALRSIVPPSVMTRVPLRIYSSFIGSSIDDLNGLEVLVIPRVFCGLLSVLLVDGSIWYMTRSSSTSGVPPAVLVVATAWPSMVLLNRPFTNALETMLLAVLLHITNLPQRLITDFITGILCALGLFTRFTFVFVSMPTMFRYLMDKTSKTVSTALSEILVLASGFLLACIGIIYSDVFYYQGHKSWVSYVTPWNALLYNSKVENLQHHGLHPRWTHAIVNMLLLYGPLAVMFYATLGRTILSLFRGTDEKVEPKSTRQAKIRTTCLWTIVSGLGFLSMAPHQEPRFLLPLLIPLAILSNNWFRSTWWKAVWIGFNVILLVVFGVLHQGGLIPSLIATHDIAATSGVPMAVLYYHTYMPPTFASRIRQMNSESRFISNDGNETSDNEYCLTTGSVSCNAFPIIDLKGSNVETLLSAIEEHMSCVSGEESNHAHVYLVTPPLRLEDLAVGSGSCSIGASYSCQHIQSYRPHLTTEDFPLFDGSVRNLLLNLELSVYKVTCASKNEIA